MFPKQILELDINLCLERYELRGLALIGSFARGEATEHSDLDLIGLASHSGFYRWEENNRVIELHVKSKLQDWESLPSWWYALEEMKVLQGHKSFEPLARLLPFWQQGYRSSIREVQANYDWLASLMRKTQGPLTECDVAFLLNTNVWEVLKGFFLMAHLPVPASSHMRRLAPQLIGGESFQSLMMGPLDERLKLTRELCLQLMVSHQQALRGI